MLIICENQVILYLSFLTTHLKGRINMATTKKAAALKAQQKAALKAAAQKAAAPKRNCS